MNIVIDAMAISKQPTSKGSLTYLVKKGMAQKGYPALKHWLAVMKMDEINWGILVKIINV